MEQTDYEVRQVDLLAAIVRLGRLANDANLADALGATEQEARAAVRKAREQRLLAHTYNKDLPFGSRNVATLTERGWLVLRESQEAAS